MTSTLKSMAEVNWNFKVPEDLSRMVKAAAALKGLSVQAYIVEVLYRETGYLKELLDD